MQRWLWRAWAVIGIVMELLSLRKGGVRPLTGEARARLLGNPAGSGIVGAFIVWLGWHWLFDTGGLGGADVVSVIAGAVLGVLGWAARRRWR